jgi:hypothetical protein
VVGMGPPCCSASRTGRAPDSTAAKSLRANSSPTMQVWHPVYGFSGRKVKPDAHPGRRLASPAAPWPDRTCDGEHRRVRRVACHGNQPQALRLGADVRTPLQRYLGDRCDYGQARKQSKGPLVLRRQRAEAARLVRQQDYWSYDVETECAAISQRPERRFFQSDWDYPRTCPPRVSGLEQR